MPPTRALSIHLLWLLVLSTGCAGSHAAGNRTPRASASPTAAPSEAALASFAAVAQRYAAAKAKGPLAPAECDALVRDFLAVYDAHGPALATAKFDAAATAEQCGRADEALRIYEELVSAVPSHALAHNNLGVLQWSRGQRTEALASFTRAVEADATLPAPRNNLAAALRERYADRPAAAEFARAELEAQRVLALDSSNRLAYENLARLYYDRGRLQDRSYLLLAQLVIGQALAKVQGGTLAPSGELHNLHGLLSMERGDAVGALRAFKRAVELEPRHADAHLNIALVAIRFRDYRTAEQSFTQALADRRKRNEVEAYLGLGVAQRGLRKYGDAQKSFEKALALGETDPRGLYNLGVLYQDHVGPATDAKTKQGFDKRPYERARDYFSQFVVRAGEQSALQRHAAEATRRIDGIDTLLRDVAQIEELEKESRRLQALEQEELEKEKQRLLELERKLGGGATSERP